MPKYWMIDIRSQGGVGPDVSTDCLSYWYFFFQAEDGIRDDLVTGVQTCALPIWIAPRLSTAPARNNDCVTPKNPRSIKPRTCRWSGRYKGVPRVKGTSRRMDRAGPREIGRASCRERVEIPGGAVAIKRKTSSIYR